MSRIKRKIFLCALIWVLLVDSGLPVFAQERKMSQTEKKADRSFNKQKYEKAMGQYEKAIQQETSERNQAALHLKTARLYFILGQYDTAKEHYEQALQMADDLLSVDDVCDYIDALRLRGQTRKAEEICLNNAYKDIHSRYQRYQNTLEALAMRHSIQEDSRYKVTKLPLNSGKTEFLKAISELQPSYNMSFSNAPDKSFSTRKKFRFFRTKRNANSIPMPAQEADAFYAHPFIMVVAAVSKA